MTVDKCCEATQKTFTALHWPPFCIQGILLKIERQQYHDNFGIPAQEHLKALSKIQSDTSDCRSSTTPRSHPLSERREQRLVDSHVIEQIL